MECLVELVWSAPEARVLEGSRLGEEFRAREENRTGEPSREVAAEVGVDVEAEGEGNLEGSVGNCETWDLNVELSVVSLVDGRTGCDGASASLAALG